MREWYTASELTDVPGVSKHRQAIARKAKSDNWLSRPRDGKKKWLEYHFDSLPFETQQYLYEQADLEAVEAASQVVSIEPEVSAPVSADTDETPVKEVVVHKKRKRLGNFETLPESPAKGRARNRLQIIEKYDHFSGLVDQRGLSKEHCLTAFLSAFNDPLNPLKIADNIRSAIPKYRGQRSLTRTTFYRWAKQYDGNGVVGLLDGYGKRQSTIESTPGMRDIVLAGMINKPHINGKQLKAWIEAGHPEFDLCAPRSYDRFITRFKKEEHQLWVFMTNPDRWKNQFMAAFGSQHENVLAVNDLWELDSTPADWMLKDGRHSVVAVLDMFSREHVWVVSKTSTANAVKRALRKGFTTFGKPKAVRTDNGADYISFAVKTVFKDLYIEQLLCLPFASEEKGSVERLMRTMSHGVLELLPGFIGHNVAERKEIDARASFSKRIMTKGETIEVELTSQELQEKLDQWAQHIYAHDPHSGLNGKTPFAVARAGDRDRIWIDDERALDMLLAEIAGTRIVTKKGVTVDHHTYGAPVLFEHVGREAMLRYDEEDLGRLAVYIEGEFICWAECPELTGTSRREAAAASKAHQKKFLTSQAKEYRQYKKLIKKDMAQTVLEHRISLTENVTTLQPPKQAAEPTFSLMEAAKAAEALDFPWEQKQNETSDHVRAHQRQLQHELEAEQGLHRLPDSLRDKFKYWVRLHRELQNGHVPTGGDGMFYDSFPQTTDFKFELEAHIDFGLEVDGISVDNLAKKSPQ